MAGATEQTATEASAAKGDWIDEWAAGLPEPIARRELARLMRDSFRLMQRRMDPPILIPESAFACAHDKASRTERMWPLWLAVALVTGDLIISAVIR